MRYRLKPFDQVHDVWFLQKRFLWIFWETIGVGSKEMCEGQLEFLARGNK